MKRLLLGVVIGVATLLVLDAAAARLGLVPGAIPKLATPSAWVASRAAGITAFVAVTADVMFGLFVSTGAMDRIVPRARSVEAHRTLSSAAVGLVAAHALVLVLDRFVRFDVIDALVPFTSGYRPIAVGLGVLAAHGVVALHASFFLRKRLGGKRWRKLHYVSFVVFPAALVHGLLAGTDSAEPALQALYAASAAGVAALVLIRVVLPRKSPKQALRPGS